MKNIIYLFAAFFIIASTQSCKRVMDEDGDLLNNLDANQGELNGARFLYQEVNSVDTIAQYNYNGLKLVEVLNKQSKTNISYNGELINKITFYKVVAADSIISTQYFSYDVTGKLITTISEVGTTYYDYKDTTPGPIVKYKSVHDFTYTTDSKLKDITSRTGDDIPGTTFEFTSYLKFAFTFDAAKKNVTTIVRDSGPYIAGTFGPAAEQYVFNYSEYDVKVNPYTLLPFGYKVSALLDDPAKFYWISSNNPKKLVISNDTTPIPVELTTMYSYDAQDYVLSGFGKIYDYRPF